MLRRIGAFKRVVFLGVLTIFVLLLVGCKQQEDTIIVPEGSYKWPSKSREYWPTLGWRTASMEEHSIDSDKMAQADEFARNDGLTRCLLVVKDGYIVFEKYYGEGREEEASNLWSVTKSFTSALVGILMDLGYITGVDLLMRDYMPQYPEFADIRIRHVLTHTTGLSWSETGVLWVNWIFSPDWIAEALSRGQNYPPGEVFKYSSGNSQFLSGLIYTVSGKTPGEFAQQFLFNPLGIQYSRLTEPIEYSSWEEYKEPLLHSWRQDPKGLEIGGFGLYLTAREMAKLGFLFLNKGHWDGQTIVSESWVERSTRDQVTDIYERYSYGYHWWTTLVDEHPSFLASGWGGQIIGIVPALDLVVVIKYEAEQPVDPVSGTAHDDMHLFELVAQSVNE